MPHRSFRLPALLLAAGLAATLPARAAQDTFTATVVDHPAGENFFVAYGLNNRGQVIASVALPEFIWWVTGPDGHGVSIPSTPAGTVIGLSGIDDAGTVVGTYRLAGSQVTHAFVTGFGSPIVDVHPTGAVASAGGGIDEAGRVTGAVADDFSWQVFVSSVDRRQDLPLGTLGGASGYGHAFRNGVVVGESTVESGASHAFRDSRADGHMVDLGTLGGENSAAFSVNARGQVVGYAQDADDQPAAFITAADGVTLQALRDLGPNHGLAGTSFANGVDRHGRVVGMAWQAAQLRYLAFVTGRDGRGMADLNRFTTLPPGSYLDSAAAINDRGQILAHDAMNEGLIWLLTPTRETWQQELAREVE
jgi:probable HAF family extracellular repeat protein